MHERFMHVIGVDLGGTNIRAAVVTSDGKILGENDRPTGADRPYKEILADIAEAVRAAARKAGLKPDLALIDALGLGSPGPLDAMNGVILTPPNLPSLHHMPLGSDLRNIFGFPVAVANDAYCAGRGECWLGAAQEYPRAAGVTLGTGFGSWSNIPGLVPEFGHTVSLNGQGALCHCGQRGCPEAYVSSYGIVRIAASERLVIGDVKELSALLSQNDALARKVIRKVGYYLGRAFVNIAHICSPDIIVVGGSIAKLGDHLFDPAFAEMRRCGFKDRVGHVHMVPAKLGDSSGILGAARVALDLAKRGGQ